MKRLLTLSTLLLLLIALPAAGSQCETFTNHSGHVPDGWTATFTENNIDYGPFVGPTFVDPETAFEGNRSWDKAIKCRTVTTTTQPTTTTSTPPTTTTLPTSTTTVSGSTTTTDNPTTTISETSTTTGPPAPLSTVPTPSTTGPSAPELAELPFTGTDDVWLIAASLSLLAGVGVLTVTRREDG